MGSRTKMMERGLNEMRTKDPAEWNIVEALDVSDRLWCYLADHPDSSKVNGLDALGVPRAITSGCPCCVYAENIALVDNGICSSCPLVGLWSKSSLPHGCTADDSPYRSWDWQNDNTERTRYALAIVALIRRRRADFTYI